MNFKPDKIGSYAPEDVTFLLRDLSHLEIEKSTEEREANIQSGKMHYSEMLPIEFQPNEEYFALYTKILEQNAEKVALYTAITAEKIVAFHKTENIVLVSLARAGTPIGILLKRYIQQSYGIDLPHYSISIIRERGIDETALQYILQQHPHTVIQFVDGWTGKGAITKELEESVASWNARNETKLTSYLAVLADPGHSAHFYGTQDDFLIPSACLNSTVSGLVSRTVLNESFMEKGDFHGAKYYKELEPFDVSNDYIHAISVYFKPSLIQTAREFIAQQELINEPTWAGWENIKEIQQQFDIVNINHIKPGVGETTRVLLRRIPWKILVNPKSGQDLTHIYLLAEQRGVPIEQYENMTYACCGLIKDLAL